MSKNTQHEDVNIKDLIAAEEELQELKRTYGIKEEKKDIVSKICDLFGNKEDVRVNRKTYILLMIFTGIVGGHRFYAKQYLAGVLYLLTCWCGISVAMTIIDVLVVIPKEVDEEGMITFEAR